MPQVGQRGQSYLYTCITWFRTWIRHVFGNICFFTQTCIEFPQATATMRWSLVLFVFLPLRGWQASEAYGAAQWRAVIEETSKRSFRADEKVGVRMSDDEPEERALEPSSERRETEEEQEREEEEMDMRADEIEEAEERETKHLKRRQMSTSVPESDSSATNSSHLPTASTPVGFIFVEYSNTSIIECRTQCSTQTCDFYAYDITESKSRLCTLHWLVEGSWEELFSAASEAKIWSCVFHSICAMINNANLHIGCLLIRITCCFFHYMLFRNDSRIKSNFIIEYFHYGAHTRISQNWEFLK